MFEHASRGNGTLHILNYTTYKLHLVTVLVDDITPIWQCWLQWLT